MAVLQAVVKIDFARPEALPDLPLQPELVAVGVQAGWLAAGIEGQQVRPQPLRQGGCRTVGQLLLRQTLRLREHALGPVQRRQPWADGGGAVKIEREVQRPQMATDTFGQTVHRLPVQGQLAGRLHAHALAGDFQCAFRHDVEGALPYAAEWRDVVHRVIDIEQYGALVGRRKISARPRRSLPPIASYGRPSHRPGCRRADGSVARRNTAGTDGPGPL